MKRIIEFMLIAALSFAVATAFLTVDKRSSQNIGYKYSFTLEKLQNI